MKNLVIITGLFLAVTIGVNAQTSPTPVKAGMKDMRHDVRRERQDKREKKQDLATGNKAGVKAENKEIRNDKKDISADRKNLKADGVKHPEKRAKRQIKKENEGLK